MNALILGSNYLLFLCYECIYHLQNALPILLLRHVARMPKYKLFIWYLLSALILGGSIESVSQAASDQRTLDTQSGANMRRQASDDARRSEQQSQAAQDTIRRDQQQRQIADDAARRRATDESNRQYTRQLERQREAARDIKRVDPIASTGSYDRPDQVRRDVLRNEIHSEVISRERIRAVDRAAEDRSRIKRVEANRAANRAADRAADERARIKRVEANRAANRAADERARIKQVEANRAANRAADERRRIKQQESSDLRGDPDKTLPIDK